MSKKIFIIEDDANILFGLQAKFRVEGFEVEINNGGSHMIEVMDQIRKYQPSFIIADLVMPKISGFDLLQKIKADGTTNNIPVFIFTSLSDGDSKSRSEKLGADYYFIKTDFFIDEFIEKVVKIINNLEKIKVDK